MDDNLSPHGPAGEIWRREQYRPGDPLDGATVVVTGLFPGRGKNYIAETSIWGCSSSARWTGTSGS